MRQMRGRCSRAGRWLLVMASGVLCMLLLFTSALDSFPDGEQLSFFNEARFGFSAFTALSYFSIGSLVWLFARQRRVAFLLLLFSLAMAVAFADETASVSRMHNSLLSAATGVSVVVALASFAILLLIFPYDCPRALGTRQKDCQRGGARYGRLLIGAYIGGHILCASFLVACAVTKNVLGIILPTWVNLLVNLYYVAVLVCILLTVSCAYALSRDLRVRQQLLLFFGGVILGVAPVLFLTVLPLALKLPGKYVVDGKLSSLALLLLPLALGYSILRYQVLVFDCYIRRAVAWVAGGVALALLCYLVVVLSGLVFVGPHQSIVQRLCAGAGIAILGPLIWWLASVVTERLFFPEIRYYREHMQRPDSLSRETFDLHKASEMLLFAAIQAFETQEVCLYVLDERTGYYHLAPSLEIYNRQGLMHGQLLRQLAGLPQMFESGKIEALNAHHPIIQQLSDATRPLFLHEALENTSWTQAGLARYLVTEQKGGVDPLLVPVRARGQMIGVLCLGERGKGQTYAGPDFEVIHLLLSHFSSVLETARLYVQASRHMGLLNALYSASARLERAYLSMEEVAVAYATVVAEAMQGAAEIWLYMSERVVLHRVVHVGQGPFLFSDEWINQLQEQDWLPWFQEEARQTNSSFRRGKVPGCLEHLAGEPFAWLPLCKGQRRMGVLMLSFPHPHIFSVEEKRILSMFARQCAAAMENAQITIALRAAYERQKELDMLKDQFIMTASHELRTPLAAVQGYIELLDQYNEKLSAETRTEFIQKAHRGCDELALMVGNITDASRLQTESERIRLTPVELISSVQHVMEIMEGVITREKRPFRVAVSPGLFIQADEIRLRQILLNLLSNALKYSPPGTPVQLRAEQGQGIVTIALRDYGPGIPPEEQGRLFERFKRLERDINSPARGAGLGLYISKRLVEAMGGRLWLESSGVCGEGSTFFFTLQLASVPQYLINETSPLLTQAGVSGLKQPGLRHVQADCAPERYSPGCGHSSRASAVNGDAPARCGSSPSLWEYLTPGQSLYMRAPLYRPGSRACGNSVGDR